MVIFASTNPQYDDRLFIELQIQYMKIPSWGEHVVYMTFRNFLVHNMFPPCIAKRRASDKDLPVHEITIKKNLIENLEHTG